MTGSEINNQLFVALILPNLTTLLIVVGRPAMLSTLKSRQLVAGHKELRKKPVLYYNKRWRLRQEPWERLASQHDFSEVGPKISRGSDLGTSVGHLGPISFGPYHPPSTVSKGRQN